MIFRLRYPAYWRLETRNVSLEAQVRSIHNSHHIVSDHRNKVHSNQYLFFKNTSKSHGYDSDVF